MLLTAQRYETFISGPRPTPLRIPPLPSSWQTPYPFSTIPQPPTMYAPLSEQVPARQSTSHSFEYSELQDGPIFFEEETTPPSNPSWNRNHLQTLSSDHSRPVLPHEKPGFDRAFSSTSTVTAQFAPNTTSAGSKIYQTSPSTYSTSAKNDVNMNFHDNANERPKYGHHLSPVSQQRYCDSNTGYRLVF